VVTSEARKGCCVFLVLVDDAVQPLEYIGVAYLIAVARRDGHRCVLATVSPDKDSTVVPQIVQSSPHFIGMSLFSATLPRAIALGRALRAQLGPDTHICAGGPVATFAAESLLESPDWYFLDSVVRGEGESVISALIAAVLDGKPVSHIAGVAARDRPESLDSLAVPIQDLDSIPWPARDQLENSRQSLSVVTVLTSRGCTGRCTFCGARNAGNNIGRTKVWRGRSPKDIVDEVAFLVSRYDVDTFSFEASSYEDPGGKVGKERMQRIAEEILDRGLNIYYGINTQACSWTEDDGDLLQLLYSSGLETVFIGIESGSDRLLKLMKKRSSAEDNRRAIRLFRENLVYVHFGLIMFHPYANWQDLEDNANFVFEHMGYQLYRFTSRLALYPGAEIVRQLAADDLLEPDYREKLEPYAYRYVAPEMDRTVRSMFRTVFSEERRSRSVKAFWWFDQDLNVYISRLIRAFSGDSLAGEVIEKWQQAIAVEQASLTKFNEAVWEELLAYGQAGQDAPVSMAETIEQRYVKAIRRMKSIQLRLGVELGRQGRLVERLPRMPA
jgi:anaerobic magnesium-protoporphyrin IX monomethyl ester cyclase